MDFITGLLPLIVVIAVVLLVFYFARGSSSKLRQDQIRESWHALIEKGSGSSEEIYGEIEAYLKSADPPGVVWERELVRSGNLLRVTNSRLKRYWIYILAYNYGTSLHVVWFLTYKKPFFSFFSSPLDLNQQLELRAYVTIAHHATKKSVQTLMGKLEQDFSAINTKSKGFLEVW